VRDLGLVGEVLSERTLSRLEAQVAIAHTRYSTTGAPRWLNTQPVVYEGRERSVAIAHNGNLVNAASLRDALQERGARFLSTSDSEVIAALLVLAPGSLEEAIAAAMRQLVGAFTVVGLSGGRLFAFRDPHGLRPLSVGRIPGGWMLASETCALDLVGAREQRELEPGELVFVERGGCRFARAAPAKERALCVFEYFYFARPDSRLEGVEVYAARVRMGELLAAEAPADADAVVAVPDSGVAAAAGFAAASGIPLCQGLIRNRYGGRSFIQPSDLLRERTLRIKLNPVAAVAGRRVVVVDDSIVRGNTARQVVALLRSAGATEVHFRVASPPMTGPCFYGIDLPDESELVAAHASVEDVRQLIGASSLAYLSLEGLLRAARHSNGGVCHGCLTGSYPTPVSEARSGGKLKFELVAR
jgi:amidophosphoribosyltransferase